MNAKTILREHGKEGLAELEEWIHDLLPGIVKERRPPHLTHEDMVKLMRWKLTRGKWRPNLMKFVEQLAPDQVASATSAGLALLLLRVGGESSSGGAAEPGDGDAKVAMDKLTVLRGVGPATASAVMAVVDGGCPFLSDEAQAAVFGKGNVKYTAKAFMDLRQELGKKARVLQEETGDRSWTAAEVERCLFLADLRDSPGASRSKSGKKRTASTGGPKEGGDAKAAPKGAAKRKRQ